MSCQCDNPDYEIVRAYYCDGSTGYVCIVCGDDIEWLYLSMVGDE